jgi:recombinational DNA repair protein (RecF pathway)
MLLFQWRLLEDCGYRPTLDVDARTNEPLDERAALSFDARAGGVTAGAMPLGATMAGGPWRVRPETVRLLRAAAEGDDAAAAAASDAALLRANRLLCVYARTILDKELPTMRAVLGE